MMDLFKRKKIDLFKRKEKAQIRKLLEDMANKPTQKEIVHGLESLRSKYERGDFPVISNMVIDECIKKVNELYAK